MPPVGHIDRMLIWYDPNYANPFFCEMISFRHEKDRMHRNPLLKYWIVPLRVDSAGKIENIDKGKLADFIFSALEDESIDNISVARFLDNNFHMNQDLKPFEKIFPEDIFSSGEDSIY